ncbi:mannose-6-phosphate isomerase, class I, partial [Thermodesulfobacteriota bacterium]
KVEVFGEFRIYVHIMKHIGILKNAVQEYAWGSHTAIPELLGEKAPSSAPQAELWMGAHPKAPSMVEFNGEWVSLLELIEKNPELILGKKAAKRFKNRLPYLFKVLAAGQPLSIQAHPSRDQALQGFERENRLGIPLNAPNRNYKDDNHKPECICALTPFWALNGFRNVSDVLSLMEKISPHGLRDELDALRKEQNSRGLKRFFQQMMSMDPEQKQYITSDAVKNAENISEDDPIFTWITRLYASYPGDIGIFAPVVLNLIRLEPGQAMFLPSGELHAYLDGVGIELMANSDNVLRGGLTPKHVDVPELLNVLNFEARPVSILTGEQVSECEYQYPTQAEEFVLSVVFPKKGMVCTNPSSSSVEIILCTEGKALVVESGGEGKIVMDKGTSIIIPAAVTEYRLEGTATLYKASVPV